MNNPSDINTSIQIERMTVYFSKEEGWIHLLIFDASVEYNPIVTCKSQVMSYSEVQMKYLRARAENGDSYIQIFEAKRLN